MSGYKEYNDVQRCLILIEEKLNWGSSKEWHNDVFIELSERIQEETKVLLSSTTLKRVWGRVNYNSAPSISTLNALAQFAGFLNWRDFKNNNDASEFTFYKKSVLKNLKVIMLSAFIIAALFLSIFSMSSNKSTRVKDYSKVLFKSRAIVEGLPNSVVFDFDLKDVKSDNILIQQYWDATKTIKIDREQKQATGQYYFPGYFRAKLLIDNQIVKEHDLFIKSNGWLGTLDYEPVPKYFKEREIKKGNSLSFSKKILEEVAELEKPITSTFHYVNDLGSISGDNFELVSNVRNLFTEKWGVCQKTTIIIVGTKSALLIPFSISGCVSEIGLMLSDVYLDGKKSDLSAFGTDLSSFKNIKIKTEDKNITVYVEGEQIYKSSYKEPLGNIVGVRFKFKGIGEVEDLMLKDLKGKSFLKI
ncbi:hypothetical protein H3Z83_08605 [Tenacibaculum sp. S7007]|uniref:Uncharacterized protein n=1 Tax=Tenacibaculum pelagium TaxID=2759527 RepID=A0A839ASF2_9FLAO|nr:hypothetical protein [Tenacibaculum pelagium]MBA6156571.1 hypothetical protein [Tenacibaculum pelagium]